jgi:hypothetical protein
MKQAVRIREDVPLEKGYQWPNPPAPKPLVPRSVKFEREQAKMDADKGLWKTRMVWGQCTVGK